MSRVSSLSVLCAGHNMIGWHMHFGLWGCICNCMINCFLSRLPFCLCMFYLCGFLFLRWSSIYWCEQMWETLVVNRRMVTPLHSLPGLNSVDLGFSFRAMAHVLSCLWALFWIIIDPLLYFIIDIVVCPSTFLVPFGITVGVTLILQDLTYYTILCDIPFN